MPRGGTAKPAEGYRHLKIVRRRRPAVGEPDCRRDLLSTEERPVTTAARPLLLLLAHGLHARDLGGLRAAEPASATPLELTDLPRDPEDFVLGAGDASGPLWDLGIAVDRSGLALRPRGRSDQIVLENLRRRPTGPAPVTLLSSTAARDVALGGGDRNRAVAELDAFLQTARGILRAGDPPEVWLVACGAVEAALVTFDFAGDWERHFAWPWRQELRATVRAEQVTVRATSQRALEHAAAVLQRPPFRGHGALTLPAPGELQFTACTGVAFGRRRLTARTSTGGRAAALIPDTGEHVPPTLPFTDWLARFWLRALALHAPAERRVAATPKVAATRTSGFAPTR